MMPSERAIRDNEAGNFLAVSHFLKVDNVSIQFDMVRKMGEGVRVRARVSFWLTVCKHYLK